MYSIIPLAGPDFFNPKYGVKPLFEIDGQPLIKKILWQRKWIKDKEVTSENLIFILKNSSHYQSFATYLKSQFVNCKIIQISDFTRGALVSCLAGISLINDFNKPIAFDLVDIDFIFPENFSVTKQFSTDENIGAILPYFKSDNFSYSYANIDDKGLVLATKEKKGWDFGGEKTKFGNASSGVYFFRNSSVFLKAVTDSLDNYKSYHHNENLFLCPAINGIIKNNYKVLSVEVNNVSSIGLDFK